VITYSLLWLEQVFPLWHYASNACAAFNDLGSGELNEFERLMILVTLQFSDTNATGGSTQITWLIGLALKVLDDSCIYRVLSLSSFVYILIAESGGV